VGGVRGREGFRCVRGREVGGIKFERSEGKLGIEVCDGVTTITSI